MALWIILGTVSALPKMQSVIQSQNFLLFLSVDIGQSNAVVYIPDAKHTNIGLYVCKVTNTHGTASLIYHISIIGKKYELKPSM